MRMKVLIGIGNEGGEKKRMEDEIVVVVFISESRALRQTCRKVKSVEGQWMRGHEKDWMFGASRMLSKYPRLIRRKANNG